MGRIAGYFPVPCQQPNKRSVQPKIPAEMNKIPSLALILLLSGTFLFLCSCRENPAGMHETENNSTDFAEFVNPFIGTSRMGHTYPGATRPFGMVQLSPQTNFVEMFGEDGSYNGRTYEYCAGYQYRDTTIIGFAHTSFSGTGHSDLGDFLLMPATGPLILDPLITPEGEKGFYSTFSHERESASPGYYSVYLEDYAIDVELSCSERVGFHQYTFPENEDTHLILDLVYNIYHYDGKNTWTFIRVENDTLVTGYRQTKGWARTRTVYFAMAFSRPISSYGHKKYDDIQYDGFYRRFQQEENFPEMAGKDLRAWFAFDAQSDNILMVKFALSPVSTAGAIRNMKAEIPRWDFEGTRKESRKAWNRELACIEADMMTEGELTSFYTALYHSMLSPILYEDVDGHYRGLDQNIHSSDGFTNYSIFSLWDTYRALHPLFNLIKPERNNDMIKSMLAHYRQSVHHMLPVWSHYANENWCMIGYHATSVIADAMARGVGNFDPDLALEACISTANVPYFDGLGYYINHHYVPDDKSHSSVSKTLEFAYNDWCIARIAERNGNMETARKFDERSEYYRNVYDPASGFMRPRLSDGSFREDFDPLNTHGQGFIEGNAWNYGLYVPHQPDTMIAMMGGRKAFSARLDSLFTMELEDKYIAKHEDITRDGIIGNYVHGNEPGHHIPYLYNWCGDAWKTQERVRMVMESMYGPGVDGLCGNDDAGQMSAWYVFSSLGFYPFNPGSDEYALGSPLVKEALIHLGNGKSLRIIAKNQSSGNVFVHRVSLNGKELEEPFITHSQIMEGGELVFDMSNTPGK